MQFHPEVVHTEGGAQILATSCAGSAAARRPGPWRPSSRRRSSGSRAGGRQSASSAGSREASTRRWPRPRPPRHRRPAHLHLRGQRPAARERASRGRARSFGESGCIPLVSVDASDRFLSALAGREDPEKKRRIIGRALHRGLRGGGREGSARSEFLVQGTLYPDVIESVSVQRAPRPPSRATTTWAACRKQMKLELVEPLRELFKDEVRASAACLGLPERRCQRHPFPGPRAADSHPRARSARERLARSCGPPTPSSPRRSKQAPALYDARSGRPSPSSCPIKRRRHGRRAHLRERGRRALRGHPSTHDGRLGPLPARPPRRRISNRIINEVKGINRVVYDISSKPPATILEQGRTRESTRVGPATPAARAWGPLPKKLLQRTSDRSIRLTSVAFSRHTVCAGSGADSAVACR